MGSSSSDSGIEIRTKRKYEDLSLAHLAVFQVTRWPDYARVPVDWFSPPLNPLRVSRPVGSVLPITLCTVTIALTHCNYSRRSGISEFMGA